MTRMLQMIIGVSPLFVTSVIQAPKPSAFNVVVPQVARSATMLAFHAPPAAVHAPVTQNGKIAGKINVRQRGHPRRPYVVAASFRSLGMAIAPAMTLNRMYHWVPIAISRILPQLMLMCAKTKNQTTNGNVMFTGKDAAICANG